MKEVHFSKEELERYSRHLILPEFNVEGQKKLKSARVLVVGAGGLGSPVLLYLTAAGVGHLGIVDFDTVDHTNLQRQVLYTEKDLGKLKVDAAVEHLAALNSNTEFQKYNAPFNAENAFDIARDYDIIVDGTDNFPTRYLVNDVCVLLNKTNVYGSIFRFEGQVSVFNLKNEDGTYGPNYRDLFPSPPPPGMVPSCAEGGVLGVLPGIVGSLQANEVIKIITGIGETLSGRLFLIDAASFETRTMKLAKNSDTPEIKELIDYDGFCGIAQSEQTSDVKEITVQEFATLIKNNHLGYQLIDVREPYERNISNIGGELLPAGEVDIWKDKIETGKQVILYCRSGVRSTKVIRNLQNKYGLKNLYNLRGGLLAWAEQIDDSIAKY